MAQEPSELESLLAALTEAILQDEQDLDRIVSRYAVPRADLVGLVNLIQRLHVVLVGVRPSRRFAQRLRLELMGEQQSGVINRLRYLPPRVQIAGGIVLVAGFMLLSRRRAAASLTEPAHDAQEMPALQ